MKKVILLLIMMTSLFGKIIHPLGSDHIISSCYIRDRSYTDTCDHGDYVWRYFYSGDRGSYSQVMVLDKDSKTKKIIPLICTEYHKY